MSISGKLGLRVMGEFPFCFERRTVTSLWIHDLNSLYGWTAA